MLFCRDFGKDVLFELLQKRHKEVTRFEYSWYHSLIWRERFQTSKGRQIRKAQEKFSYAIISNYSQPRSQIDCILSYAKNRKTYYFFSNLQTLKTYCDGVLFKIRRWGNLNEFCV